MSERDPASLDRAAFLARLRAVTPARVGLGRRGASIATADHLAFAVAHARARDAVHTPLDTEALLDGLNALGWLALLVRSRVRDRHEYLARPDRGRCLHPDDLPLLRARAETCDVAIVIADGLSASAVGAHATPVLERLLPALDAHGLRYAPLIVAEGARVALGDEIGENLRAKLVCVLIGERPGLSSPDSLGIYLTWAPAVGRTDADRNCISNIHAAGLSYADAAARCDWLIAEALQRTYTGVALKDGWRADPAIAEGPPTMRLG